VESASKEAANLKQTEIVIHVVVYVLYFFMFSLKETKHSSDVVEKICYH